MDKKAAPPHPGIILAVASMLGVDEAQQMLAKSVETPGLEGEGAIADLTADKPIPPGEEVHVTIVGQGSESSFLTQLNETMKVGLKRAKETGQMFMPINIQGLIRLERDKSTEPEIEPPEPRAVVTALVLGKFRPMDEDELKAFEGVEGEGYIWDVDEKIAVIADMFADRVIFEVYHEGGRLVGSQSLGIMELGSWDWDYTK